MYLNVKKIYFKNKEGKTQYWQTSVGNVLVISYNVYVCMGKSIHIRSFVDEEKNLSSFVSLF
jgi:hypothetical protein